MPIKTIKEKIKNINTNGWRVQSGKMIFDGELKRFRKAFKNNFVTLIVSSLGLLVALTWNNFWNAWISTLTVENTLYYKFYLAIGLTVFAVILTYVFSRIKGE